MIWCGEMLEDVWYMDYVVGMMKSEGEDVLMVLYVELFEGVWECVNELENIGVVILMMVFVNEVLFFSV